MSSGFKGTIVHGVRASNEGYSYRTGLGMMPCAEFAVFHDDFFSFIVATDITNGPVANTPWGWQGAIIDTGSTAVVDTTAALGANGVLQLSDATVSEGVAIYGTKSMQLTAGKKCFIECRVRTDDVTDNTIQFGLSDLTATINPEDLWTTAAANLITFGILDGTTTAALTQLTYDKSNGGPVTDVGVLSMTADTWHTLGIYYDGVSAFGFVDGVLSIKAGTVAQVPNGVALAPFFGARNGNGAGANNNYFDYFRVVSAR
jgi:hypothetical protein